MSRLIITNDKDSVTAVIKNFCSITYNKENQNLNFISTDKILNVKCKDVRITKKSIVFHYTENNDECFIFFCKSSKNSYSTRATILKSNLKSIAVFMPSVVFNEFRIKFYNIDRVNLLRFLDRKIYFTCKAGRKTLVFLKNRIFMQDSDLLTLNEVNIIKVDNYQLAFKIKNEIYYLSKYYHKRSFDLDNIHFGRIYGDTSGIIDVWLYFSKCPPTKEDRDEINQIYLNEFTNLEF